MSFWSHSKCYVLLPGTLLEIIQVKKQCYGKKSNAQKYYCDNDFAKTNYDILIHEQSADKLPTAPRYWIELTGIFESEGLSNKQRDAQEQPQCP